MDLAKIAQTKYLLAKSAQVKDLSERFKTLIKFSITSVESNLISPLSQFGEHRKSL